MSSFAIPFCRFFCVRQTCIMLILEVYEQSTIDEQKEAFTIVKSL